MKFYKYALLSLVKKTVLLILYLFHYTFAVIYIYLFLSKFFLNTLAHEGIFFF